MDDSIKQLAEMLEQAAEKELLLVAGEPYSFAEVTVKAAVWGKMFLATFGQDPVAVSIFESMVRWLPDFASTPTVEKRHRAH